ncbi:sugar transferase [Chitinispirillales bacterium ANBcel5]|uniref:sugar transferase n=1 Tax=Cellulosispirillum alkaliphilum TaxID=3039283 RepID=UPI002A4FE5F6|nr:sugar transferase [Chitinispirillales bacterium ANBcel5]
MKTMHRQVLLDSFKLADVFLLVAAFIGADILVNPPYTLARITEMVSPRISALNSFLGILMLLSWHLIFLTFGAYNTKRFTALIEEAFLMLKCVLFCTATIVFLDFYRPLDLVNLPFVHFFFWLSLLSLMTFRVLLRHALGLLRAKGRNVRYILIAGTGERALSFYNYIDNNPELGYRVLGFVDSSWHGPKDPKSGLPEIVCDFDSFSSYIRKNVVDEVVVCLPIKTYYQQITTIMDTAQEQGILLRMSTDLFKLKQAKTKVEHMGESPLITVVTGGMYTRMVLLKSIIDFLSALILIFILSPLIVATMIAVKLTSKGPVFFLQPRVGMNKRIFNVVKFRTMGTDAEKKLDDLSHLNERKDGAAFKITNDPRVTPIGKILRKFSIDELPQLFNVLRGDMSLVGPRPLPIRDYEGFDKDWQRRRFSVKPGITCIWQVSGRDNITFDQWMEMDMEYIDQWSLWLDMKILFKTVPVSIFGVGAS